MTTHWFWEAIWPPETAEECAKGSQRSCSVQTGKGTGLWNWSGQ